MSAAWKKNSPYSAPKFPKVLTRKGWDGQSTNLLTKKAIKDPTTSVGKKDLRDAMDEAEKAYNAVNWKLFDIWGRVPTGSKKTMNDLKTAVSNAVSELTKVRALEKALTALEDRANLIAKKYKAEKGLPKGARKAAENVAAVAKEYSYNWAMGTMSDVIKSQATGVTEQINEMAAGYENMKGLMQKYLKSCLQRVNSGCSVKDYAEFWKEDIRGVGTQLPKLLATHRHLMSTYKTWKTWASQAHSNLQTQEEINNLLKLMKPEIVKITSAIA